MHRITALLCLCAAVMFVPGPAFAGAPPALDRIASPVGELPPGTDEGWWSTVRETIGAEEYHVAWRGESADGVLPEGYRAPNRTQGFTTSFTEAGIRVVPQAEGAPRWIWGLEFSGIGRGATAPAKSPALAASGNRIEYFRGASRSGTSTRSAA